MAEKMKPAQLATWIGIAMAGVSVIGYGISIERRFDKVERALDLDERVGNIERMLFPIMVEMKVRERQAKMQEELPAAPKPKAVMRREQPAPIREQAETWAEREIQRARPEFRKEQLIQP